VAHLATRPRDLQDALLRHDPQIVHFAGHGDDDGVLYLGDEHGRPRPVGKEALGNLFGTLSEWIEVVIVNGCDTLPTVEVLGAVVDYAIGMNRPLGDAAAILFAEAFYGALAMGHTVQRSFALGVSRMELDGNAESATPVLRIRPGVDPALPLVARPADGAGERAINLGELHGEDVLLEKRPGREKRKTKVTRIRYASGRGFVFRNR
jgi:hypothetical protein